MNKTQKDTDNAMLIATGLKTYFPVRRGVFSRTRGYLRAVDGVDLVIHRGRTLGLVGESGSGKTTLGRTLLRLIQPTEGKVVFDGQDVFSLRGRTLRSLRRRMQIIFQDPVGSLNPRMTVGEIIREPLRVHKILPSRLHRRRVAELLERVGLSGSYLNRYPHEFSGGQRQRIGIARALASGPEFVVCDEPVSALDVSIQAQILNLLSDLQDELGLSYLFIAHNLSVVEHFADEVAVMYLGKIVELAGRDALYARPIHPYTHALLSSAPLPERRPAAARVRLAGETPSPINPPDGCAFHPRCPFTRTLAENLPAAETQTIMSEAKPVRVVRRCVRQKPSLQPLFGDPAHYHACILRGG